MYLLKKNLTRKERLCRRKDLKRLFINAKKVRYKGVTLLYLNNEYEFNRIAVIAKKGFKTAVDRNRKKRLAKEAYRHFKPEIKGGYDLIIFVIPGDYTYTDFLSIVQSLLKRSFILG